MNDDEYSIKKQLETLHQDLKRLSDSVLELTVINRHLLEERNNNNTRIERIDNDVTEARGAIALLKWITSVFGVSILSFFVWIVSSHLQTQQKLADYSERLSILKTKIESISTYEAQERLNQPRNK